MAVASLFKAVLGQNWYPARPSAVSSSQKLGATGVGVAASVGVGVAVNVGVGTVASVEVGVTESVAPVGVATCVVGGAEDVADTDATAVELAMKVVTDTTTMLLVGAGERPRSKSAAIGARHKHSVRDIQGSTRECRVQLGHSGIPTVKPVS